MGLAYRIIHPMTPWWHNRLTRMRVKGEENVPAEGAAILAIQHLSWWDPIIASTCLTRPIHYLGKREVMVGPLTDRFFRSGGIIPVDRKAKSNEEAIRKSLECLEDGNIIGIFPEGTRGRPGEPLKPKPGVARLALLSGAPVIPCSVLTDRFWPRDQTMPKIGEPVYARIGEPLRFRQDLDLATDKDACRKIADEVMTAILKCRDEADAARERKESWRRLRPRAYYYPGEETVRGWFGKRDRKGQ